MENEISAINLNIKVFMDGILQLGLLILTGLAFLVYKHPSLSRSIIQVCFVICILYFIVIMIYHLGKAESYIEATQATRVDIYKGRYSKINFDSLYATHANYDSVKELIVKQGASLDNYEKIINNEQMTKDSILQNIIAYRNISDSRNSSNMSIFWICIICLGGLYFLSFYFDDFQAHKTIEKPVITGENEVNNQIKD